jgi:hypothetical protein
MMEIKAMVIIQLLLDLVLGIFLLWFVWRGGNSSVGGTPRKPDQKGVLKDIQRWDATSRELVERMHDRLRALETVIADLDRAEIRASETLKRMERMEVNWTSTRQRYDQASDWIRTGTPIEEVAQRTGFGIDELRLMQELSLGEQRTG